MPGGSISHHILGLKIQDKVLEANPDAKIEFIHPIGSEHIEASVFDVLNSRNKVLNFEPLNFDAESMTKIFGGLKSGYKPVNNGVNITMRGINNIDISAKFSGMKNKEVLISQKIKGKQFARPVIIYSFEYRVNFYNKGKKMITLY